MNVAEFFGASGPLSKLPGYAVREGQITMASAIERVMEEGGLLAVEGPTGVGKTRAYSVPSLQRLFAARNAGQTSYDEDGAPRRKRVLFVTAGIALQEQIVGKDLPALAEVMPEPFSFRLFKGRGNYACNLAVDVEAKKTPPPDVEELIAWANASSTGDRSELEREPSADAWRRLSTTSEDCMGRKHCPFGEVCFFEKQRAAVKSADVVVCNYHVFFAHVGLWLQTGEHLVLPEHDVIVFDEAHELVDIARDFFGWKIGIGAFHALTAPLRLLGRGEEIIRLNDRAKTAFRVAAEVLANPPPAYAGRFRNPALFQKLTAPLRAALDDVIDIYKGHSEPLASKIDADRVSKALQKAERMDARLKRASASIENLSDAVFLESENRSDDLAAFSCRVVDIEDLMADYLEPLHAAVATSATLNLPLFVRESGFAKLNAETLEVPSPFEYEHNALLVVPDSGFVAMPTEKCFVDDVAKAVEFITTEIGGRTLGLFTSYRSLNATRLRLDGNKPPFKVLVQGDAPKTKLINAFREDESSVLLGTDSMWAGVDVPGRSLSCVVIDKIPFDSPDDPIQSVLKDRNPKTYFMDYAVPRAIVMLKQGFGRLIRSTTDYGVVVILDRRISEARYGALFTAALPPVQIHRSLNDVKGFLEWRAVNP